MKIKISSLFILLLFMSNFSFAGGSDASWDWNVIRGWSAIIFGLLGAVLGSLGYVQARNTKKIANKIQADELLDEAFDNLGEKEGTFAINREIKPSSSQLQKGFRLIKKAKELCPKYARVYSIKAVYLRANGQFNKALEEITTGLKFSPNNSSLHNHKANLLDDLGLINEALESYKESIQLNPDYSLAYDNLGLLQKKTG